MYLLHSRFARLGLSVALSIGLVLAAWASVEHTEELLHPFTLTAVLLGGMAFYAFTGLLRRTQAIQHEGWKRLFILTTGVAWLVAGLFAAQFPLYSQRPLTALAMFIVAGLLAGTAILILGLSTLWVIDGFKQADGSSSE